MIRREMLQRFRDSTSSRTFGLRLREVRRGRVTLEMRAERRFLQAHGRVHGGVIALLADTAAALAVYSAVPPQSRVLTLEMKINFLAGVENGAITARGKVLRVGKSTGVSECEVRDSRGRLAAKALVTVAIGLPPEPFPRSHARKRGA
jgi:acyl-CoA thioesterase